MNRLATEHLAQEWREAGITEGDHVLVHSSVARTLRRLRRLGHPVDPGTIVESFLAAVGSTGSLLAPLFNFQFTRGVPFDMRSTKSEMGSFTEAVRQWPGAVRTGHPIYSFAVLGAEAPAFAGVENYSGYGADSPFAMLRALRGKIAVLDLPDQQSMTFYHHVEEMLEVDYRYHKSFTGAYTDEAGATSTREFGLFVRDLERGVRTAVEPMGEVLWRKGLYSGDRPNEGSGLRVIDAEAMFNEVADVIRRGDAQGLLYAIG